ncbi:MAG: ketoacyl-ACP synthase III [Chloroflexi bacterium]|nr:ketoacyl-ACP synthase III [Chloroflexota bacterium]
MRAEIVGWGMCAPRQVVTNADLALRVETSDEWIRTRTGIERRHIAGPHDTTSTLAIEAARRALQVADADPREIDLIIVGTATPDYPLPSTACMVQDALGAAQAGAFDLNAGCSGFVYALAMGQRAIVSGANKLVLVIGADVLSRITNWADRGTCVLFGDGAGAVLLRASATQEGVLSTVLGSDGSGSELLIVPAGGAAQPASEATVAGGLHTIRMNGQEVYRFATQIMPTAIRQVAESAGVPLEEIALIVPHQANLRILETAAKRLKLPLERFAVNLQEYGNTSAASIPMALCEAIEARRVLPGQNVALVGFGAGLTWAAALVRWSVPREEAVSPGWRAGWRWLLYRAAAVRGRWRRLWRNLMVLFIRGATDRLR